MTKLLEETQKRCHSELKEAHGVQLRLEYQLQEKEAQFNRLQNEVGEAKTREAWQPEIKKVLEALQRSEHERAVGAFEHLLTALLKDILPGERQVLLDLSTSGGFSSLDISLLKDEHIPADFSELDATERAGLPIEDALHGAGGAVANVLSMGLRMITLLRSGQRRFLVLDEADCWIKPTLVGAFAKVVQQAAIELGVQVLMISHHDESHFDDIPHRLQIRKTEKGLCADWSVEGEKPAWDDEATGFRSLALCGFQAHQSTYLPLSPGVTLLYGENDVGKSSIVTALRAVFYGETSDALIRHGQASAKVMIEMEQGKVLSWERHRKAHGKDKVKGLYSLRAPGSELPLHETAKAKGTPDWLFEETGMGLVDDLDVQLGSQKDPVFLLNRPASQRARALAVGTDSGYVQTMMDVAKEELGEAKSIIKRGERQLEQLHREIQISTPVRQTHLSQLLEDSHFWQNRIEHLFQQQNLAKRWKEASIKDEALSIVEKLILPELPAASRLADYQALHQKWIQAEIKTKFFEELPDLELDIPSLKTAPGIRALAKQWMEAIKRNELTATLNSIDVNPSAPTLHNTAPMRSLLNKWEQASTQAPLLEKLIEEDGELIEQAEKALTALYPAVCPTCEQPWNTAHLHEKKKIGNQEDPKTIATKETQSVRRTRVKPE